MAKSGDPNSWSGKIRVPVDKEKVVKAPVAHQPDKTALKNGPWLDDVNAERQRKYEESRRAHDVVEEEVTEDE